MGCRQWRRSAAHRAPTPQRTREPRWGRRPVTISQSTTPKLRQGGRGAGAREGGLGAARGAAAACSTRARARAPPPCLQAQAPPVPEDVCGAVDLRLAQQNLGSNPARDEVGRGWGVSAWVPRVGARAARVGQAPAGLRMHAAHTAALPTASAQHDLPGKSANQRNCGREGSEAEHGAAVSQVWRRRWDSLLSIFSPGPSNACSLPTRGSWCKQECSSEGPAHRWTETFFP